MTSEPLSEGNDTHSQQSAGDQQEEVAQASTQQGAHVSSVQRNSHSGMKSSFRSRKENIDSSSSISKQNSFSVLADQVEKPQRDGGYPLRDRRQTQMTVESKSQGSKKKPVGKVGGAIGHSPQT